MVSIGCLDQSSHSADGGFEATLRLSNFNIRPSMVAVKKGDTVRLTVEVVEGEHNIFIEGYDLRTPIGRAGHVQVLEFAADLSGEFEIWCEVRDHRERGMTGRLIVN